MKYLKLSFLLLLIACNHAKEADFGKIKHYSFKLETESPVEPPYVAEFTQKNKKLWYLAAVHSNNLNSSTFQMIDKFLSQYKPEIIIIEGLENEYGISPFKVIKLIQGECSESQVLLNKSSCGENLYIASRAYKDNIPFIGGEPSDKAILELMQTSGYKKIDYVNFLFTRMIPQFYREGKINSYDDIEEQYSKFTKSQDYFLELQSIDYLQYETWLNERLPLVTFKQLIDANFSAPIGDGNYLQKLSSHIESVRDRNILQTIFNLMKKYNKVLILYGHSHFLTQKDVIEERLGKYRNIH